MLLKTVLLGLGLTLMLSQSASAAYRPPGTRACGLQGGTSNTLTDRVYVRNVSCATGRAVIRRIKSNRDAPGWTCALHNFPGGKQGSRCVGRGARRVYGLPTADGI